jgi:hypothetical protein
MRKTLQEQCLFELLKLDEATRTQLVAQSRSVGTYKDASRGANRFQRKKYSKVANAIKSYNEINMNDFWKSDILKVNIPIVGETDEYTVTIKLEGVVAEIQKNVKNNNNKFEFRTVIQALTKVFNTSDVYVKCTCPDHKYRFAHWNIIKNVSVDDSSQDPGPGKGIANPNDDKGRGRKHVLLVISNGSWMMKVASVVLQYALYMDEHKHDIFKKLIFPKIYGVPAEEAAENNLVVDEEVLESDKSLIAAINDWSKNKGKFKKGSNINPVYANKLEKEQAKKKTEKSNDKPEETADDNTEDAKEETK